MWLLIVLLVAGVITGVALYLRNQDRDTSVGGSADNRTAHPGTPPEPVVVGPADLDRAEALLERFEQAVGDSDALYNVFAAISRAGGGVGTFEEHIRRGGLSSVEARLPRPWYWLAAVAAEAQRAGNPVLVARVFLFTEMFVIAFLPQMNLAGSMDAGLERPPNRARAQIAMVGLDAVAHLPADQVVAGNQTGVSRVHDVRLMCAHALTELRQGGAIVPGEVLARAQRIVQTGDVPQTADILTEITTLVAGGRLVEALDRAVRHQAACRQARGAEDPATIRATAALGLAQLRAGKLYDVVATLEPAYPLAVRVIGDGFPTIQIAANLAAALRDTERADQALPLLEDALAACQRTLGSENPTTLAIRSELAATHTMLDHHSQAIDLHRQLLADRTRVLGPHHADTLTSVHSLAEAYHAAGDLKQAIAQHESAAAASQEALGAEHPDTLSSQHSLAGVYADADRVDEAISLYDATLAARRRTLGVSHLDTLNTMNSLAIAYTRAGRNQQALTLLEEAAAGCAESLAPDHPIAKNIEMSLLAARMMATPLTAAPSNAAPVPPTKRKCPPLERVASFTSPGQDSGIGHAWSPSGDRLAVAGFDNSVCVFDPASGQLVWQTHRHGTVTSVSWSPDGQTLASGTSQRTVHLFAAGTGTELRHAGGHDDEIRSIAYASDGRLLATAGNDGKLCIWDATDLRVVATIAAHAGRARAAVWAPDSASLASCGQDNTVRTWQVGAWSVSGTLTDHTGEIPCVAYSPDRRLLASGSLDGTVRVWDLTAQRYQHVLDADRWWVLDLAFSPDSQLLAALSNEEVLVFDLGTGRPVATALAPFGTQSISWGPGGRHLTTVGFEAIIWALPGGGQAAGAVGT